LGATKSVAWEYAETTEGLLQKLKAQGYTIILIEQTTESQLLHQFNPVKGKKYCLVFGNEVNGVSEEALPLADLALEVPQSGTKHSLNVSVCLGIITWEFFRKLQL
jgi:tRNA G18 (ribose-2'-O)-methylase SpoU